MNKKSSLQQVARDVLDLCELQLQLLSVDSQAAKRKFTRAIVCGVAAVTLAGSGLTVVIGGAGLLLGETTRLSPGVALLVVGVIAFVLVALLLATAIFAMKTAAAAMAETKSEFAENLRWLRATLVSPQSSARNQMRSPDVVEPRSVDRSSQRFCSVPPSSSR